MINLEKQIIKWHDDLKALEINSGGLKKIADEMKVFINALDPYYDKEEEEEDLDDVCNECRENECLER